MQACQLCSTRGFALRCFPLASLAMLFLPNPGDKWYLFWLIVSGCVSVPALGSRGYLHSCFFQWMQEVRPLFLLGCCDQYSVSIHHTGDGAAPSSEEPSRTLPGSRLVLGLPGKPNSPAPRIPAGKIAGCGEKSSAAYPIQPLPLQLMNTLVRKLKKIWEKLAREIKTASGSLTCTATRTVLSTLDFIILNSITGVLFSHIKYSWIFFLNEQTYNFFLCHQHAYVVLSETSFKLEYKLVLPVI